MTGRRGLVLRADANARIGTGHLMRTPALVDGRDVFAAVIWGEVAPSEAAQAQA